MNSSKVKKFKLSIPTYNYFEVTVKISDKTIDSIKDTEEELNIDLKDAYCAAGYTAGFMSKKTGVTEYIIHLPKKFNFLTIQHECLHLSWYVLGAVGVKVTEDNHEALAYLCTFMVEQVADIYDSMKVFRVKRKKQHRYVKS